MIEIQCWRQLVDFAHLSLSSSWFSARSSPFALSKCMPSDPSAGSIIVGSIMLDSIMPSDSLPLSSTQKERYMQLNNGKYNTNLLGCIGLSTITEGFRVGIHWQYANNRCTHRKALQETLEIDRASFSQVYGVCMKHVYEFTFTAVNDWFIYCVDAVNKEKRMWTHMHTHCNNIHSQRSLLSVFVLVDGPHGAVVLVQFNPHKAFVQWQVVPNGILHNK